jgi:uncharacterized repeat protein (TIGR03803 family)
MLYGMTSSGGSSNDGTIFSINTNGSGFQDLLSFNGTNGATPGGTLTVSGSMLYGATSGGNSGAKGTIFSIKTNGTGFQNLVTFDGDDGAYPDSLVLSGSALYGTTSEGGYFGGIVLTPGEGTVFSVDTNGTGFQTLFTFGGSTPSCPGNLILSGSTLYGTALGQGTGAPYGIFSIDTDGTGFKNLCSVGGVIGLETGSLALSGSAFFGTTPGYAGMLRGSIYSTTISGSGFQSLYSFSGGTDGAHIMGGLTLVGSKAYGMSEDGGSNWVGNIFSINTDGTGFQTLYSFSGSDGEYPYGDLILSGSTLYGMTTGGGSNGDGVIFSLTVPEPSTLALLGVGALGMLAYRWRRRR